MNDAEHWRAAYVDACEQCQAVLLIRAVSEIREKIGPDFVNEALRQLTEQRFFVRAAEKTVAHIFAQQFARSPDGVLLAPLH